MPFVKNVYQYFGQDGCYVAGNTGQKPLHQDSRQQGNVHLNALCTHLELMLP